MLSDGCPPALGVGVLSDRRISMEVILRLEPVLLTIFVRIWADPLVAQVRLSPGFALRVTSISGRFTVPLILHIAR